MVSKYELSFFYFKMEFEYLKWFLQRERERENDGFSFFLKTGLSGLIVWISEKLVGMYGFISILSLEVYFGISFCTVFWEFEAFCCFRWTFFCHFINFYPYVGLNSCGVSKLFLVFCSLSHIFMEVYIWVSKFKNGHWASSLIICVPLHDFSNLYVSSWVLNFFCYSMKFE